MFTQIPVFMNRTKKVQRKQKFYSRKIIAIIIPLIFYIFPYTVYILYFFTFYNFS